MQKEFTQVLVTKEKKLKKVTVTIDGVDELRDSMLPVILANVLLEKFGAKKHYLIAGILVMLDVLAVHMREETFNLIMKLAELEISFNAEGSDEE